MGRPSKYRKKIAKEIFERMSAGETLTRICKDPHLPTRQTVLNWRRDNIDGFFDVYAQAKQNQADFYVDEIIEISDDGSRDYRIIEDEEGIVIGQKFNSDHFQRSRLRVDTRKWLAAKFYPKVYGDMKKHEHSGPGGGPVETESKGADIGQAIESLSKNPLGKLLLESANEPSSDSE